MRILHLHRRTELDYSDLWGSPEAHWVKLLAENATVHLETLAKKRASLKQIRARNYISS